MRSADLDRRVGCITLPALREAGVDLAFATIFTEPSSNRTPGPCAYRSSGDLDAAEAAGLRQVEFYHQLEQEGEITIVRTRSDLDRPAPLPRIVLLMEGADPIRSPDHVARWFDHGVRIVGLTWAAGTRYAAGNQQDGPISPLGLELVRALDAQGLVHDASHLADRGAG